MVAYWTRGFIKSSILFMPLVQVILDCSETYQSFAAKRVTWKMSLASERKEREDMSEERWEVRKVYGRDEVLREVEKNAKAYGDRVVQDFRNIMNDFQVDIYRLVIAIGRRYGMDTAYEIMSDMVVEKRLKWIDQAKDRLSPEGTDLDRGLDLFVKYLKPGPGELEIIERSKNRIVLKRKEYVSAISHACHVLGLDVIEVNNKVYARATNFMFEKINLRLKHVVRKYNDGWYEETIELT
jgi:hypothetical protein